MNKVDTTQLSFSYPEPQECKNGDDSLQMDVFTGLGLLVMLSGCGGPLYVPVEIRDNNASVVSVRAQWLPRTQVAEPSSATVNDGIEIQYIGMSGNDEQSLPENQFMSFGGTLINRPQTLVHNIDISYAHVAYSSTARFADYPFDLDAFMGAGRVGYRLNSSVITSPPLTLQSEEVDFALSMGLGLRWWFVKKAAFEGRLMVATQNPFSFLFDSFGNGDQTDLLEGEVALVYKPFDSVDLRGGFAKMALTPETPSDTSTFEFTLGGPFLGLVISF